jgi:hypothetical protein
MLSIMLESARALMSPGNVYKPDEAPAGYDLARKLT